MSTSINNKTVQILPLDKSDDQTTIASRIEQFREIRLKSLQSDPNSFSAKYENEVDQPDRFWEERLRRPGVQMFMISTLDAQLDKSSIVGMIGVVGHDPGPQDLAKTTSFQLQAFWVEEAFRGKGIGAQAIETVKTWATARSSNQTIQINVSVALTNTRALKFYKHSGFVDRLDANGVARLTMKLP